MFLLFFNKRFSNAKEKFIWIHNNNNEKREKKKRNDNNRNFAKKKYQQQNKSRKTAINKMSI